MENGQKKVTIKSLSKEVDILKEQAKEINILKEKYDDMEKIVDILKKELDLCKSTHSRMDNHGNDVSDASNVKSDGNCIENIVKCKLCEQTFTCKRKMKTHMKTKHPRKKIKCEECDLSFDLNVNLERHLDTHKKPKMFKCNLCEKEFHLKWRLTKHMSSHSMKTKFCHYYNNDQVCPFESSGCMYAHVPSPQCHFQEKCFKVLCQFTHKNKKVIQGDVEDNYEMKDNGESNNIHRKDTDESKQDACVICRVRIPDSQKQFKCEECELYVCEICAQKSIMEDDKDYFMCLTCQQ